MINYFMHIEAHSSLARLIYITEAFVATFLWASSYILIKWSLTEMDPISIAYVRYLVGGISLFIIYSLLIKGYKIRSGLKVTKIIVWLLGFTGFFIAPVFQYWGLDLLTATQVAFLMNLTPLWVLVFGNILMGEKPNTIQSVGIGIVFIGILLYYLKEIILLKWETIGIIVTLTASVSWALYIILTRYHLITNTQTLNNEKGYIIKLTTYSMIIGSVLLTPFSTNFYSNLIQYRISINVLMILLWLGVVNTALAYTIWNHSLKYLKAFQASIIQSMILIEVLILSLIFLNESVNILKLSGILVLTGGVILVNFKENN